MLPLADAFLVQASGDIGMGTSVVDEALHIERATGEINLKMETGDNSVAGFMMKNSLATWTYFNTSTGGFTINNGVTNVLSAVVGITVPLIKFNPGDVTINPNHDDSIQFRVFGDIDFNLIRTFPASETMAIGKASADGKLHIHQNDAADTISVLALEQAKDDEPFTKIIGTSVASDATKSLIDAGELTTPGAIIGWEKVEVDDTRAGGIADGDYYRPIYAAPTA